MLEVLAQGEPEAGPTDGEAREALAEAVLCLARVDPARKALWRLDAPRLLQKGYELEEDPAVCAAMEATAELFLQDGFEPGQEGPEHGADGPILGLETSGSGRRGSDGSGTIPAAATSFLNAALPPGGAFLPTTGLSPASLSRRSMGSDAGTPSNPSRLAHIEEID